MADQIEIEPLPLSIRKLLKSGGNTHPGLLLDKYVQSWSENLPAGKWSERVQEPAIRQLVKLSQQPVPGLEFDSLKARYRQTMLALGSCREIAATTIGPMTLHLSRASSLENAGICLHPLYGFVYLPGSGVKGMSRAWAETVWLPGFSGAEREQAKRDILQVFGNEHGEREPDRQSAGDIVFHDAWPESWPRLQEDILNSHHQKYYSTSDNKNPPGDWEDPIPVYFLSVVPQTQFRFWLTARHPRVDQRLLSLAEQFVVGALLHNGAGAKTSAGYGAFRIDSSGQTADVQSAWTKATTSNRRASFECEVELVTPAFLAGADQELRSSCDLRSATLRGILRAWWRTMHSSWLEVKELRRIEAMLWGDTNGRAAIRTFVAPVLKLDARPFDRDSIIKENAIPFPKPGGKEAHGITYHSYGCDDTNRGQHKRRFFVPVGHRWRIRFVCDSLNIGHRNISAKVVMEEAIASLRLLTSFGGIGTRSRRGFGNINSADLPPVGNLASTKEAAGQFRTAIGVTSIRRPTESPSIDDMLPVVEVTTPWKNYWLAIDRVAMAAQRFAQGKKYDRAKRALGLPRVIGRKGSPRQPFGTFRPGADVEDRHSSPLLFSFSRDAGGKYVVRLSAWPAARLPDSATSRSFLGSAIVDIATNINAEISVYPNHGVLPAVDPDAWTLPAQFSRVTAVVFSVSQGTNVKWKATVAIDGVEMTGAIINSSAVQIPNVAEGQGQTTRFKKELIIERCSKREIAFTWPTPEQELRISKAQEKGERKKDNSNLRRPR